MKRLLKILTAAFAVILLFTTCKQFMEDPEEFFSYWASETFVKSHSIGSVYRPDGVGVPCVSSSADVLITLTVYNPKNFPFVMPTSSEPEGIIEFKELSEQPKAGTYYELKQTGPGTLELTYKSSLLQKYEQGSGGLNPTITLKAADGRVFKKTYTFGIKSNTPPPKPAVVLAKTNTSPSKYVLCFKFDSAEMAKMVTTGSGTVPVHKDIAKITINGSSYSLLYNNNNLDFQKPVEAFEIGSFIGSGEVEKLTSSSPNVPSGAWVLYFKTDIKVESSNEQTSYTITLSDKEGVVSDSLTAELKEKFKVEFNAKDGTPEPDTQYIENGGKVTEPPNPDQAGYTFGGWYKNADCSDGQKWNFATDTVTSNITLYAKWTAGSGTEYKVEHYQQNITNDNYSASPADTDDLSGMTGKLLSIGDGITLKDYSGFEYDHMDPASPTIAANGSTVVKLYYKRKTYQVDFRVDGLGGTISAAVTGAAVSGSPVTVKYGGSVTFTATPATGYAVDSWTGATVDTSNNKKATLSNVTGNKTVKVKFKKVYTVTFKVVDNQGGYLSGSYGGLTKIANYNNDGSEQTFTNVSHGTTVEFTATPYDGWKVEEWKLDDTALGGTNVNYTSPPITKNTIVTVEFEKVTSVAHGNNNAWQLLKKVVEIADNNAVITIDGEIKATSGDNKGQIVIKNKSLTIKKADGATSAVLDANTMSRIFKVENGANLTLENLTLTGGKATGTGDAGSGGAIYAKDASTVNITNCTITGNEAYTNGGGLNVEGTPTTITNCTFTGNTAKNGGGIYIIKTSNKIPVVTIEGGTIGGTGTNEANKATGTGSDGNGGGIYVGDLCKVILQNNGSTGCTIKGNTAQRGGVYANNADVIMKDNTRIAVDNDVYLDSGSWIQVAGALSNNPAARITVPNGKYLTSTKVLDGNAALLNSEHGKFAVTPKGDEYWTVGNDGRLTKDKAAIFNNITNDQIEAAYYSMIYDEYNIISDRTILLGKLVLYKTNNGNYGIMHVTEVNNTSHSGQGHIKFNSKTFNQYGGVEKEETDKVLEGGECFQFEFGGDPGSKLDFYLKNETDGTKSFNPLNLAKFYILSN